MYKHANYVFKCDIQLLKFESRNIYALILLITNRPTQRYNKIKKEKKGGGEVVGNGQYPLAVVMCF